MKHRPMKTIGEFDPPRLLFSFLHHSPPLHFRPIHQSTPKSPYNWTQREWTDRPRFEARSCPFFTPSFIVLRSQKRWIPRRAPRLGSSQSQKSEKWGTGEHDTQVLQWRHECSDRGRFGYFWSCRKNRYDFRKSKMSADSSVWGVAPLGSRNKPSWMLISSNSSRFALHTKERIEFLIFPRIVRSTGESRFIREGSTIRPCFMANGVYENNDTLSFISLLSGAKWSYDWK